MEHKQKKGLRGCNLINPNLCIILLNHVLWITVNTFLNKNRKSLFLGRFSKHTFEPLPTLEALK